MHTSNKNSTGVELSSILEELIKANIKFVLVGGLAAVVQGAPVTGIALQPALSFSPRNSALNFLRIVQDEK